ncbi:MAG: hypothetical protein KTR31_06560 [Myxococcales bacterium]|nr:hypothetical protein [Myxococcales bacterium]
MRAMGGAFTAVAESPSAQLLNPAALVMRRSMVEHARSEVDGCLQARAHPFLHGEPEHSGVRARWQVCGTVRHRSAALGLHLTEHEWRLGPQRLGTSQWSLGTAWATGTVAVGILPHLVVQHSAGKRDLAAGASAGALVAPAGLPLRLGARVRTPTRTSAVRTPAQIAVGASTTIGATNRPGSYGPARAQHTWGAPWALLAADLVWTGPSADAVDPTAWTAHEALYTSPATVSAHLGAELWALQHDVRLRLGAFTLPGRGAQRTRIGGSVGAAAEVLQAPNGTALRITGAIDAWRGSLSYTVGVETW